MKRLLSILLLLLVLQGMGQAPFVLQPPNRWGYYNGEYFSGCIDFTDSIPKQVQGKPNTITGAPAKAIMMAGGAHDLLALGTNRRAYWLGDNNSNGQGAKGSLSNSAFTTMAMITTDSLGNTFDSLAWIHSGGTLSGWTTQYLKLNGTLWLCGATDGGLRGDGSAGSTTLNTRPVQVPFPAGTFIKQVRIDVIGNALDTAGNVYTWGGSNAGFATQYILGQNTATPITNTPTKISFPGETGKCIAISGSSWWNYALFDNGDLWGWGYFAGQLGITGAPATVNHPVKLNSYLSLPAQIKQVGVTGSVTYVILSDSSLWAWGDYAHGGLGNGQHPDYFNYKAGGPAMPFNWDQGFQEFPQIAAVHIAPGKNNFTNIWDNNSLTYMIVFEDADGRLWWCGRNKGAVIADAFVAPGVGNFGGVFPNSWDVPWLTEFTPDLVTTLYTQGCEWCETHPTDANCSPYTHATTKPTVSAGGNKTLSGPTVTVIGTATPQSGTKVRRLWSVISGPNSPVIPIRTSDTLVMKGVINGTYVLQYNAVDNNFGKDSSTMTLTVSSVAPNCNCSYFFASSGSDANVGTDSLHPFATMAKLNTLDSDTSASFYRKRGDTWTEAIRNFAGKRLDAYGNGPGPMSNGFVTLTSPTSLGGGVYQYTCAGCYAKTNMLLMNGVQQPLARFPNTGSYLTYQSGIGTTSITSSSLTGTPNWTGGLLAKRHNSSTVITDLITGQSGGTLTYAATTGVGVSPNFGFIILNDTLALDTLGEYTTTAPGFIKMFFGAASPGSYTVKVATIDTLIGIAPGAKNVTIVNQNLQGANICGICMVNDTNVVADRDTIQYSGGLGYYAYAAVNSSITNSLIQYCNDNGIMIGSGSVNHHIINDSVYSIGMMLGQGKTLPQDNYKGITNDSKLGITTYNRVGFTGYDGIMGYQYDSIHHNIVHDFCKWINDGAGIYSLATGGSSDTLRAKYVADNIVYNGVGDSLGTNNNTYVPIYGIYFDQNNTNTAVLRNTMDSIKQAGLFIHNSRTLTIRDNTINNCKYAVLAQGDNLTYLIRGIAFKKNTLAVKTAAQQLIAFVVFNNAQFTSAFGAIDSNAYCFNNLISKPFFVYPSTNMAYKQWTDSLPGDTHSGVLHSPVVFGYNTTASPKAVVLASNYVDVTNKLYQVSATVAPWQALVLIDANMISYTRGRKVNFTH